MKPESMVPLADLATELGMSKLKLRTLLSAAFAAGNATLAFTKTPSGVCYDRAAVVAAVRTDKLSHIEVAPADVAPVAVDARRRKAAEERAERKARRLQRRVEGQNRKKNRAAAKARQSSATA